MLILVIGFFTPEEYRKYIAYLNGERKRQFSSQAPPPPVMVRQLSGRSSKQNTLRSSADQSNERMTVIEKDKHEKTEPDTDEKRRTAPRSHSQRNKENKHSKSTTDSTK